MTPAAAVVSLLLASGPAEPAADRWVEARADGLALTVLSNAPEAKVRELVHTLEALRGALRVVRPELVLDSKEPVTLYAFRDDASLTPFKGRYGGEPRNISGFFSERVEGNLVVVDLERRDAGRVAAHELLHTVLAASYGALPHWLAEGLAETYGALEATPTEVRLGRPIEEHVRMLRQGARLPFGTLVTVDSRSPEYNEEQTQGLFYAESWALVRHLLLDAGRARKLDRLLALLREGVPQVEALRQAIQEDPEVLLAEAVKSALSGRVRLAVRRLSAPRRRPEAGVTALSPDDSLARLGDLLGEGDRDAAEVRYAVALVLNPDQPRALAGLGRLRLVSGRLDEACSFFEDAVAAGSTDSLVHYHLGVLLLRSLREREVSPDLAPAGRATLDRARLAFFRALALRPGLIVARLLLVRSYLAEAGDRLDEAIDVAEDSVRLFPERADLARDLEALRELRRLRSDPTAKEPQL